MIYKYLRCIEYFYCICIYLPQGHYNHLLWENARPEVGVLPFPPEERSLTTQEMFSKTLEENTSLVLIFLIGFTHFPV